MATSKITSGIETTTATAASGVSFSVNNIMKKDNILRVRLGGSVTLPSGTYTNVASIPSEYAPRTNIIKAMVFAPTVAGYFRIYTDGTIQFQVASGGNVGFFIDETLFML